MRLQSKVIDYVAEKYGVNGDKIPVRRPFYSFTPHSDENGITIPWFDIGDIPILIIIFGAINNDGALFVYPIIKAFWSLYNIGVFGHEASHYVRRHILKKFTDKNEYRAYSDGREAEIYAIPLLKYFPSPESLGKLNGRIPLLNRLF